MKKRILFLVIILMGTMLILCACGEKTYSIEDFEKVVEDDSSNFDEAIKIYEWLYENMQEEIKNTSQSMDKLFSNLYDNYSDEKMNREQIESYLDKLSEIDTGTAILISSINTKMNKLDASRSAYREAEKYYEQGEYALAIEKYEKVIFEDKNYQDANNKIILSNEQIVKGILDEVNTLQAEDKYEEALSIMMENQQYFAEDVFIDKYNEIYGEYVETKVNACIETASHFINNFEYKEAIDILREGVEEYPGNGLEEILDNAIFEYFDIVEKESQNAFKEEGHKAAIEVLDNYCDTFSGYDEYEEKLKYYIGLEPDNLLKEYKWYSYDDTHAFMWSPSVETQKDVFGNSYSYSIQSMYNSVSVEYYIPDNYVSLVGVIAPYDNRKGISVINIYADDVLIYTSPEISGKTQPVEFQINIKNKNYIKIELEERDNGNVPPQIIVGNLILNKY